MAKTNEFESEVRTIITSEKLPPKKRFICP